MRRRRFFRCGCVFSVSFGAYPCLLSPVLQPHSSFSTFQCQLHTRQPSMQATLQIMQATPLTTHLLLLASISLFCERERLLSCSTHAHTRTHEYTHAGGGAGRLVLEAHGARDIFAAACPHSCRKCPSHRGVR